MDEEKIEQRLTGLERTSKLLLVLIIMSLSISFIALILGLVVVLIT